MTNGSLRCFGVGDGAACGDRSHSSYLYQFGDMCLLVDCGEPVSRSFKASGLSYETIDRIFISHLHSDHIGGLFMLLQGFWLEKRRKDLRVHLPADAIAPLRQMLNAVYLFDEVLPFKLHFEPLRPGHGIAFGAVRVTPHRTTHLEGFRKSFQQKYPGDYAAHSFLIETDRCRLGHSADLGTPADLAPLLAKPLDLLVCELAHFSIEELLGYLQGHAIKHLVLTHLDRRYWENLAETQATATKLLPGARISYALDMGVIGI